MADPRKVGHSARRRMGASSSHLGQAGGPGGVWSPPFIQSPGGEGALAAGEAAAQGNVRIPIAGGRVMPTGRAKGVPPEYPTATKPPLGDNSAFVAGVSSTVEPEPHPGRHRAGPELANSRLTISPSMKVPQESPVPTQGGGRPVPSTASRQGSFAQGQGDTYFG